MSCANLGTPIAERLRAEIVREAREWIGTPYHDHAEVKGRDGGVDCAQLIRRVFINVGLVSDFTVPYYSPQQFLHSDAEDYLRTVMTFSREIAEADARPGDVVLYKMGRAYGHGAIIIDPGWPSIIHAWSLARMVCRGDGLQEIIFT